LFIAKAATLKYVEEILVIGIQWKAVV